MQRNYDLARERGVTGIVRDIDSDGLQLLRQANLNLGQYVRHARGRLLDLGGVAITTMNMFDTYDLHKRLPSSSRSQEEKADRPDMPTTDDVVLSVRGLAKPISAYIEGIGVYGLDKRPKLGLELVSEELTAELEAITSFYAEQEVALRPEPLYDDQAAESLFHYSFATIAPAFKEQYSQPRLRRTMGEMSELIGQKLTLLPVSG